MCFAHKLDRLAKVLVAVTAVQVGGYNVQDWAYLDPLSNVLTSEITDCHRHPELKRKLYSSYAECDEGELAIPLPRQIAVRSTGSNVGGVTRESTLHAR